MGRESASINEFGGGDRVSENFEHIIANTERLMLFDAMDGRRGFNRFSEVVLPVIIGARIPNTQLNVSVMPGGSLGESISGIGYDTGILSDAESLGGLSPRSLILDDGLASQLQALYRSTDNVPLGKEYLFNPVSRLRMLMAPREGKKNRSPQDLALLMSNYATDLFKSRDGSTVADLIYGMRMSLIKDIDKVYGTKTNYRILTDEELIGGHTLESLFSKHETWGQASRHSAVLSCVCPFCSMNNPLKPEKHYILFNGEIRTSMNESQKNSGKSPNCQGFKPLVNNPSYLAEQRITDITRLLGAKAMGDLAYLMARASYLEDQKVGALMRDYSNPRGTVLKESVAWGNRLSLSPQIYITKRFSDGSVRDLNGFEGSELMKSDRTFVEALCDFMRQIPPMTDGRRYELQYSEKSGVQIQIT